MPGWTWPGTTEALRGVALRAAKPVVLLLVCVPFAWLAVDVAVDRLGANPVETVLHRTGDWALRLLLCTLAVTPLRRLTGWHWPLRVRRTLGLATFGYAVAHAATWLVLDRGLVWEEVVADVLKRPYVTLGFSALLLLLPLALTSTRAAMRRLGRNWQRLHRLVYPAAVLAALHFVWLAKAGRVEPLVYGLTLAALLLARVPTRPRGGETAAGA